MEYKTFSRDELIELLTNGIPIPKSALFDDITINFYFEELNSFINTADNTYDSNITNNLEITIMVDHLEFLILRHVDENVLIYLANTRPDIIETMTSEEATDVIGIVYGITVFNEKWIEVNEIVEEFTQQLISTLESESKKTKPKLDPKVLEKINKSPVQYPDKTMKVKDFDKYFKKDKDKKYG